MRTVILDARFIATPRAMQRYMQFMLDFPAHYGRNLDALHDMLREMDRPTRIVLLTGEEPSEEMAAYLPRLAQVFEDSARENANLIFEMAKG